MTEEQNTVPRRKRRARWWIAGAAVCAVALAGGGIAVSTAFASQDSAGQEVPPPTSTAAVEEGTLSGTRTVAGVLDFADTHDLQAGVGGVLTQLPEPGSQIGLGGELYRVDNVPVFLFTGGLPAWRPFERGMQDGPDVAQLETGLRDLGYFDGEPDEEFDWHTQDAIESWQEANGQEETGRIDLGRIVFAPTDLRVGELETAIGGTVGAGTNLYRVSGLDKQITADVKLVDQALAKVDVKVQIHVPGGTVTTGTISSVGQPEDRDDNGTKQVVIPIVIALDDAAAADGLQRANVTVDLPSETRENVLSVPVDALIALPGGSFGVEAVRADGTTEQLPVDVGLYAGGRVEISGDGIAAGLDVVVPKR